MRTITDHKVNGLNEAIEITANSPGPGGASHEYQIRLNVPAQRDHFDAIAEAAYNGYCESRDWKSFRGERLPSFKEQSEDLRLAWRAGAVAAGVRAKEIGCDVFLSFQNGPITTPTDFNGITNESLLAVLIDRMRGFQFVRHPDGSFDFSTHGKFACEENEQALCHLEGALMWLQKRTRDRMARGVEGTMNK